jgi:hypothetical protein
LFDGLFPLQGINQETSKHDKVRKKVKQFNFRLCFSIVRDKGNVKLNGRLKTLHNLLKMEPDKWTSKDDSLLR